MSFERNLARNILLRMLRSEDQDDSFSNPNAWDYIDLYLVGPNNKRACIYYLQEYYKELTLLSNDEVTIARQASNKLMALICNIKPNAGSSNNSSSMNSGGSSQNIE